MNSFFGSCALVFSIVIIDAKLTNYEYEKVPPVFDSDDFVKCRKEGDLFCRLQFSLRSNNDHNEVWKIIEKTKGDQNYFARDVVYRYRCFPNVLDGNNDDFIRNATVKENTVLQNFSLNAHVDEFKCNNYAKEVPLTRYDYVLLYSTEAFLVLLAVATLFDIVTRNALKHDFGGKWKLVRAISLLSNWEDLRKTPTSSDYIKLKSLEGVRTYNMAIVILGHSLFTGLFSYVSDAKYVETFYFRPIVKFGLHMGLHVVQTNFLISAWLLANHLYSDIKKHRRISFSRVIQGVLLRYLRLFPALAFTIFWQMSNWSNAMVVGPPNERMDLDYKACQSNWWATLLFVNNFFLQADMCNLGTWYLSNDFQMFIIAMVLFYMMSNYNIGEKIILWATGIFWAIHACLIYSHETGVIFVFSPENAKIENSLGSYNLYVLYTSIYANFGSYGVGLIFGMIYYKYKDFNIKITKVNTILWFLLSFGLSFFAVYLSMFKYSPVISALLGASLKPMYSLGIAMVILGISHGMGGIIKKICEWDFVAFVARWTYSTYLIHFGIVFGRAMILTGLMDLSDEIMFKEVLLDLVKSFTAGLILHLIVERPLANILKLFLQENLTQHKKE